ncbi:MAG: hypothetical protein JWM68_4269 [Verrucomicrobiales bacterium]|nr:hypothetical protein [Verrucomicrobiales bacterium]
MPAVVSLKKSDPEPVPGEVSVGEIRTNNVLVTNAFSWAQLESPDFSTYIANLRGIGCPERTIADIIIAEVEELYERKCALVPLDARFWETDVAAHRAWLKRAEEQLRLEREKTTLLRQLLGITWFGPMKNDAYDISIAQFFSGIADEKRTGQLVARVERTKHDDYLLGRGRLGLALPEDRVRDKARLDEYLSDLAGMFTPGEMQELKLRNAFVGSIEKGSVSAILLSVAECREVARLMLGSLPEPGLIPMDDANSKILEQLAHNESFQNQLRTFLGEARYARYQIAGTGNFTSIYRFVKDAELPRELSFDIARLSVAAENDAKQLRGNTAIPSATRATALKAVRHQIEQKVSGLVGTNQTDFLRRNEYWLKELEAP